MKLTLVSHTETENSTISDLFIDGVYECKILEPTFRGNDNSKHVEHKTAINEGDYNVVVDYSEAFKRLLPHVLAVKDYPFGPVTVNTAGVRIHWGNYPKDTEACLLTGKTEGVDFVGNSVIEFNALFDKFQNVIGRGQTITLHIDRTKIKSPIA